MLIINWPGCISSWANMRGRLIRMRNYKPGMRTIRPYTVRSAIVISRLEQYPSATIAYFQAYNLNRENAGLAGALVNTLYRMGVGSPDYILEGVAICDTALIYNRESPIITQ